MRLANLEMHLKYAFRAPIISDQVIGTRTQRAKPPAAFAPVESNALIPKLNT